MALVNHAKKEINAKIIYYGPQGGGKATILSYIYARIKPSLRGEMRTVPAGSDRLLIFDFSPFENALPNGYHVRLHIYTLTGAVMNPATWKMTLKGADGIIIVTNPAADAIPANRESVAQLRDFLTAYGMTLQDTPVILQLNSFVPHGDTGIPADYAQLLDIPAVPLCRTCAANGDGVIEALTSLSRTILGKVTASDQTAPIVDVKSISGNGSGKENPPEHVSLEDPDMGELSDAIPMVTLLSREIVSTGKSIRIPLEIGSGTGARTVIVTVAVELE